MMLSKLYLFALLLLVQGIDNEHDRLSKMNKALKEAIKSLIETEVADFGALASLGACPKGKELTETQCRGLKGSQYGSKWAYADEMGGYWAGKETCGCYIDQNGKRYFNRRPTGHKYCGADQGEKMICVKRAVGSNFPEEKVGMQINIETEGVSDIDAMEDYVHAKFEKLGQFFDDISHVDVVLKEGNGLDVAEAVLQLVNHKKIYASSQNGNIWESIDSMVDKLLRHLYRITLERGVGGSMVSFCETTTFPPTFCQDILN